MKLRSPSLTKTSRRTIACGAFHLIAPIFRWGFTKKEKISRWDISEKVILSTETARTLQDVQKGQQILIQDGYLSASVSKHYPTTNSHWHASDASSVLADFFPSSKSELHPTWKGTVTLEAGQKIRVHTVHSVYYMYTYTHKFIYIYI